MEQMETETEAAPPTFFQRVQAGDQHALWKAGIRSCILVFDIVGIGCLGWIISSVIGTATVNIIYYNTGAYFIWGFIPLGLSIIWCTIVLLVQLLRASKHPVHPGLVVGLDLVLWLAFVITALFAVGGAILEGFYSPRNMNYDSSYDYSNGWSAGWHQLSNGTWEFDYRGCDPDYYRCDPSTKPTRRCGPRFSTCAQEDAYVNKLMREQGTREGTEYALVVMQWLNVILHFTLFVWACVDTHRLNKRPKEDKIQVVAERIIKDMQDKGLITVHAKPVPGSSAAQEQSRPLISSSSAERDPDEIQEIGRAR